VSFAKSLDKKDGLKMFTKLPARFKIDTPLGTYNPDWGIVIGDDEKVCMVRETKFGAERMQRADVLSGLREDEKMKILCGKKHFDAVDVDFKEATQRDLSDLA
jgi:type III restriction enzyme